MSKSEGAPFWHDGAVIKTDGAIVAQALDEEQARRIVACLSVCAGVDTARIEQVLAAKAQDGLIQVLLKAVALEKQRDELQFELSRQQRLADIGLAIARAVKELPVGFRLQLELEQHGEVVRLYRPDGNEDLTAFGDADSFAKTINNAIDAAKR